MQLSKNRLLAAVLILSLLAVPVVTHAQIAEGLLGGTFGGAILGSLLGGRRGARIGAAIGAATGGIAGGIAKKKKKKRAEEEARRRAAAERQRLEQEWRRQEQQEEQERMQARAESPAALSSVASATTIIEVQKSLVRLGFDPGMINGQLSADTVAAIKAYQSQHGLLESGEASDLLLKHMLRNGG